MAGTRRFGRRLDPARSRQTAVSGGTTHNTRLRFKKESPQG
jgi:hypothetical protein